MGQDQSRPPGFEFLDSGRLHPTSGNIPTTTTTATSPTRHPHHQQNNTSSSASSLHRQNSSTRTSNGNDDSDNDEEHQNSNVSPQRRNSSRSSSNNNGTSSSSHHHPRQRLHQHTDAHQFYNSVQSSTSNSKKNVSSTNPTSTTTSSVQDRTALLEQRQDERRFQLMFQTMKMCQQEFEQEHQDLPNPSFEIDSLRWSVFALLRSCRHCGAYCPNFRNSTLTGSQPALVLICDDCAASSSHEAVNATVDSVAAAVSRMPGFHGSAVSGTWQIPVVNHFDALIGAGGNTTTSTSSATTSSSSTTTTVSTFQQHYYSQNTNISPSHSISSPTNSSGVTRTAASSSTSVQSASASVRYLLNALLYGHGPVSVLQGVSGTAVESCAFASVLPGLEFVSLSTTCNQRENDLEQVRRRLWKDREQRSYLAPLQFAFEGRSFDDKSLMFLGSAPFRDNVTHLSVKHCDRITSAGFKLIASYFPNLRKINFCGSSNLDLDVFQEPITEESANVLELLTVTSYDENKSTTKVIFVNKNPLCYNLRVLDFSEGALQFETRIGVFGRLQGLNELNLGGCENIRDAGVVDMFRQAVASICEEKLGLLPLFTPQQASLNNLKVSQLGRLLYLFYKKFSSSSTNNHNTTNFFETLYEKPLETAEIEILLSNYHDLFGENNNSSRRSINWISKLNLSGLRFLSDFSIRWLCGTFLSLEEYHRLLLTVAEERVSLNSSSSSSSSSSFSLGLNYGIHQSSITSIFAEKMCLICPREEFNERNYPNLWNVIHHRSGEENKDEEDPTITNNKSNDQNERRLNLLISPRNQNDDDDDEIEDDSTSTMAPPSSTNNNKKKPTRPSAAAASSASEMTSYIFTNGGRNNTNTNFGDDDEDDESDDEEKEEIRHVDPHNVDSEKPRDHHTSSTYGKIAKVLSLDGDGGVDLTTKAENMLQNKNCCSWLANSLKELNLSDCTSLTPFSFVLILSSFPKLEVLDVSGNVDGFTDRVLEYLFVNNSIPIMQNLRSLNISRCSRVGIENVCKLLHSCPSITEFYGSPFVAVSQHHDDNEGNDGEEKEEEGSEMIHQFRQVTKSQIRILGLFDPEFALNFVKLLAREAKKKRNEILNEADVVSCSSSSSLLRTLHLPSMSKLAEVESKTLRRNYPDRFLNSCDDVSLSRMSMNSVHQILRDAKHQWNCDLEFHHVY